MPIYWTVKCVANFLCLTGYNLQVMLMASTESKARNSPNNDNIQEAWDITDTYIIRYSTYFLFK